MINDSSEGADYFAGGGGGSKQTEVGQLIHIASKESNLLRIFSQAISHMTITDATKSVLSFLEWMMIKI